MIESTAANPATEQLLWDGLVHGLALRIRPSGARTWIVQKSVGARTRRVSLGRWPDLTIDQARRQAQEVAVALVRGDDPTAEKKARRERQERQKQEAIAVAALWDRYWTEGVLPHNRASTAAEKKRMWERRIKPAIGRRPVRDVTGVEVSKIVRSPLRFDPKTGAVIGGKGEAGNLHRLLHHLFKKGMDWRLRPLAAGNPADEVEQPKVSRRERLLRDNEVAALLIAVARAEASGEETLFLCTLIRLLVISGFRVEELLKLRHEDIHAELCEVHLADTKTGASVRPVAQGFIEMVGSLPRRPGVPWLFPSVKDASKPLGYTVFRSAFDRMAVRAGLLGVHPHLLRHRFVTLVANSAPNQRAAMQATGHKSWQAFAGYVHAERRQIVAVVNQVGEATRNLAERAPDQKVRAIR